MAGGQAGGHSFTGPQVESPVPSCAGRLRRSAQQLASCWQGARRILTPLLLSCWAASGTWSGDKGREDNHVAAAELSGHLASPLSWGPPVRQSHGLGSVCGQEEAGDNAYELAFQHSAHRPAHVS